MNQSGSLYIFCLFCCFAVIFPAFVSAFISYEALSNCLICGATLLAGQQCCTLCPVGVPLHMCTQPRMGTTTITLHVAKLQVICEKTYSWSERPKHSSVEGRNQFSVWRTWTWCKHLYVELAWKGFGCLGLSTFMCPASARWGSGPRQESQAFECALVLLEVSLIYPH